MSSSSDQQHTTLRTELANARRVVVKVGSRLIAESPAGRPAAIADQIASLRSQKIETVVVSSGAISLGIRTLNFAQRPHQLPALQAAAAVGQGQLYHKWEHAFSAHNLIIAQVLLTHDDITDRKRFLNARHALSALLENKVVPIINENDTVAVDEIKYGDNDLIAALVCNLVSADALVLLTDVDGLYDENKQRVAFVRNVDQEAAPLAKSAAMDGVGSGGMSSKVQAAKIAARNGVPAVVASGRNPSALQDILSGQDIGTLFLPTVRISSRKHWIAYSGRAKGTIIVDAGAQKALTQAGRSLLPAGICRVEGEFELGDIISLRSTHGAEFARGLAGYRSADMRRIKGLQTADIEPTLGYKYLDEVIHRDDLVLL